jgi:hypothetical protein
MLLKSYLAHFYLSEKYWESNFVQHFTDFAKIMKTFPFCSKLSKRNNSFLFVYLFCNSVPGHRKYLHEQFFVRFGLFFVICFKIDVTS